MLRNRVFKLGKVHIWVVQSCKGDDLLMFRNLVFRLRNVQIWTVLSCKVVDVLMLRNGVFRQRDLQEGRKADAQESRIEPAKGSDMGSAVL